VFTFKVTWWRPVFTWRSADKLPTFNFDIRERIKPDSEEIKRLVKTKSLREMFEESTLNRK